MNVTDMSAIYKWVDGKDLHIDRMSSDVYRFPVLPFFLPILPFGQSDIVSTYACTGSVASSGNRQTLFVQEACFSSFDYSLAA
jgi:hypothetical protein